MKNWSMINDLHLVGFANGLLSGRQFYALYRNNEVRKLLWGNGVDKARQLAKRALNRRKKVRSCVV
jgi:hypothetical protein